jgi:hypothetical protein
MDQKPVNQRIIFLLKAFRMSARTFSEAIGESATNTQNYVGKRNAEPRAGYLENIMRHFASVNPLWLLTGEGQPFLAEDGKQSQSVHIDASKNKGNLLNSNKGSNITQGNAADDCQKDLAVAQKEIELLRDQLKMQERTIQILLKQTS